MKCSKSTLSARQTKKHDTQLELYFIEFDGTRRLRKMTVDLRLAITGFLIILGSS
jgi:hypothetical protein